MSVAEAPSAPVIDVRTIPPFQRHQHIFDTLRTLRPAEHFFVVADHEPRPLQFQIESNFPGLFAWEYVESGPEVWRVKIAREDTGCGCSCS